MSIQKRWRFTESMVRDAPEWRGVYVLWRERTPLAVGHAAAAGDTIQARLLTHLANVASAGTHDVTHYSWEICANPVTRCSQVERELGLAPGSGEQPAEGS